MTTILLAVQQWAATSNALPQDGYTHRCPRMHALHATSPWEKVTYICLNLQFQMDLPVLRATPSMRFQSQAMSHLLLEHATIATPRTEENTKGTSVQKPLRNDVQNATTKFPIISSTILQAKVIANLAMKPTNRSINTCSSKATKRFA